jgi:hypothetical protein
MNARLPRPAVIIDDLFDDPTLVERILARQSPHPSTLAGDEFRENRAHLEAAARAAVEQPDIAPPWLQLDGRGRPVLPGIFRTTWADGDDVVEEGELIANHPRLIDAAKQVFAAEVVRPYFVYSNISTPMGRSEKHTDIPAFRGIDRSHTPVWLLTAMHKSGLFGRWQINIATGVAWFYTGDGGEFAYWPDGPDGESIVFDASINTCIVGDNDFMPHQVQKIGRGEPRFSFDATITFDPEAGETGRWVVEDDGLIADFDANEIRVSISWKAQVFTDVEAARVFDEHEDDLDLASMSEVFRADLARHDIEISGVATDPEFGAAIRNHYSGRII